MRFILLLCILQHRIRKRCAMNAYLLKNLIARPEDFYGVCSASYNNCFPLGAKAFSPPEQNMVSPSLFNRQEIVQALHKFQTLNIIRMSCCHRRERIRSRNKRRILFRPDKTCFFIKHESCSYFRYTNFYNEIEI